MASGGNFVLDKGFIPSAAITKYTAVKLTALETVTQCSAESDVVLGFAQTGATAGEVTKEKQVNVRLMGITLAVVGTGGVTLGLHVCIDGSGQVVAQNTGARMVGIALQTKTVGQYVSVLLAPAYLVSA